MFTVTKKGVDNMTKIININEYTKEKQPLNPNTDEFGNVIISDTDADAIAKKVMEETGISQDEIINMGDAALKSLGIFL